MKEIKGAFSIEKYKNDIIDLASKSKGKKNNDKKRKAP